MNVMLAASFCPAAEGLFPIRSASRIEECPVEPDREQAYRRRIATLEAQLAAALERIAELEAKIARLQKNSSNSSKPPSSDIVKPPKPAAPRGGGKIGGQPGHERHERTAFSPEQIDRVKNYTLQECPDCGGRVRAIAAPPRVLQQVELLERPVEVVEHRGGACQCERCGKVHQAAFPPQVARCGLMGPRLTAFAAYLKGACHASYSTIKKFFRDVLQVPISRGHLVNLIHKATASMDGAYAQLQALLPKEKHLNADETGHQRKGNWWTWCFRSPLYTLFKIAPSRGSEVLVEMLGREFDGVLGCDYFSAYHKYMDDFDVLVQFCLAHLIRDVKFLTTLPDAVTRNYGRRVLEGLRALFHVIHRREKMDPARFGRALEKARDALLAVGKRAPQRSEARNLARRFREHGDAYFRFITTPGIEPTNNLAEQAIRFVVIDRLVTQGTRGEKGRRWSERIWTAMATCVQQGRSVFDYLRDSLHAHLRGAPTPSLLPAGP
jgi:transposase